MTYQVLTPQQSPYQSSRDGKAIDRIVIHWWGDPAGHPTLEGVVAEFENTPRRVSAHWVAEAGRVAAVVPEDRTAWHAGNYDVNQRSIGIECNPRASDEDYATIGQLIADIRGRHGDLPLHPHHDYISTTCPGVYDLGRLDALARGGVTTVSNPVQTVAPAAAPSYADIRALQRALRTADDNVWGPDTQKRWDALLAASNYGGVRFPYGVAFTQGVVGTAQDNRWGPNSRACHDATVRAVQVAVGAVPDGIVGPETVGKVYAAHAASRHTV